MLLEELRALQRRRSLAPQPDLLCSRRMGLLWTWVEDGVLDWPTALNCFDIPHRDIVAPVPSRNPTSNCSRLQTPGCTRPTAVPAILCSRHTYPAPQSL